MPKLKTKDIEYVAYEKKCINFNGEFSCPSCRTILYPVCINLGMIRNKRFYCYRGFPENCQEYGCPKYIYVDWKELTLGVVT